nr:LEAF RUST 10 DISEASE-RESISTANCE LOCUS RECEPTOR-LIKE PROTEIN KINASE-like 2.5 [Quercus suber]
MASVYLFVFFVLSHLLVHSAVEGKWNHRNCASFHCEKFGSISFPFASGTNSYCGLCPVDCDETTPSIQLGRDGRSYDLINISQSNTSYATIHVKDRVLQEHLNLRRCKLLSTLTFPNNSIISFEVTSPNQTLFKCKNTLNLTTPRNFKNTSCNDYNIYYSHSNHTSPSFPPECSIIQLPKNETSPADADLYALLTADFNLEAHVSRDCISCYNRGGQCQNSGGERFNCEIVTSLSGIGVLVVIICYFLGMLPSNKIWKKESPTYQNVKAFLRSHGPLGIRRYKYSEIKKITNSFKDKLGQGGYGGVYKGKLQDGCFVAVKVLKESKGNGEEFLNEVASISRTSHVNIVTLMGFCFEESKRALIYEFMPNGSLEKFIYKENPSNVDIQLGWETLYNIAIGIGRGLEYLHKGCNTRILHFDIKPHNILLDENFNPKISDFGLAKICPREKSIISMVGARGTIGYIAPEVFCRNFGGVSHKSDVYSYGMMVLEMVGVKNIDVSGDCTSEVYFPHWIYKRLELKEELELKGILNEADQDGAMKMIIVSLWCIQTSPTNRPPMSRVVDMLEGSLNSLQIPPNPFLSSPPRSSISSLQYDSVSSNTSLPSRQTLCLGGNEICEM